MLISPQTCPCQINPTLDDKDSLLPYKECCQPYHDWLFDKNTDNSDGIKTDTAERLMRSRYSAFVLIKPKYIVKTTLPAQQKLLDNPNSG